MIYNPVTRLLETGDDFNPAAGLYAYNIVFSDGWFGATKLEADDPNNWEDLNVPAGSTWTPGGISNSYALVGSGGAKFTLDPMFAFYPDDDEAAYIPYYDYTADSSVYPVYTVPSNFQADITGSCGSGGDLETALKGELTSKGNTGDVDYKEAGWAPACLNTQMTLYGGQYVWSSWEVPTGNKEFKVARGLSWYESWGTVRSSGNNNHWGSGTSYNGGGNNNVPLIQSQGLYGDGDDGFSSSNNKNQFVVITFPEPEEKAAIDCQATHDSAVSYDGTGDVPCARLTPSAYGYSADSDENVNRLVNSTGSINPDDVPSGAIHTIRVKRVDLTTGEPLELGLCTVTDDSYDDDSYDAVPCVNIKFGEEGDEDLGDVEDFYQVGDASYDGDTGILTVKYTSTEPQAVPAMVSLVYADGAEEPLDTPTLKWFDAHATIVSDGVPAKADGLYLEGSTQTVIVTVFSGPEDNKTPLKNQTVTLSSTCFGDSDSDITASDLQGTGLGKVDNSVNIILTTDGYGVVSVTGTSDKAQICPVTVTVDGLDTSDIIGDWPADAEKEDQHQGVMRFYPGAPDSDYWVMAGTVISIPPVSTLETDPLGFLEGDGAFGFVSDYGAAKVAMLNVECTSDPSYDGDAPTYTQGKVKYTAPDSGGCLQWAMTYKIKVGNMDSAPATILINIDGAADDKASIIADGIEESIDIDVLKNDPVKDLANEFTIDITGEDEEDWLSPDCGSVILKEGIEDGLEEGEKRIAYTLPEDGVCHGDIDFNYSVTWTGDDGVEHNSKATVTVTILQVVNVVYVDDDAAEGGDNSVTPKSGPIQLNGKSGDAVVFSDETAESEVPDNYVYLSTDRSEVTDGFDKDSTHPQTITVHVGHPKVPPSAEPDAYVVSGPGAVVIPAVGDSEGVGVFVGGYPAGGFLANDVGLGDPLVPGALDVDFVRDANTGYAVSCVVGSANAATFGQPSYVKGDGEIVGLVLPAGCLQARMTYRVTADGWQTSAQAAITVSVASAVDDEEDAVVDQKAVIDVLGNDPAGRLSDADKTASQVEVVLVGGGPGCGSISVDEATRAVWFTPNAACLDKEEVVFDYRVEWTDPADGALVYVSDPATVTVTVAPKPAEPPAPPSAEDDAYRFASGSVSIPAAGELTGFLTNDKDGANVLLNPLDFDAVGVEIIYDSHGVAAVCLAGSPTTAFGQPVYNRADQRIDFVLPEGCLQAVMDYAITVDGQTSAPATITVTTPGAKNDTADATVGGAEVSVDVLANDPARYLDPDDYEVVIPKPGTTGYPSCGDVRWDEAAGVAFFDPGDCAAGKVEFTYEVDWTDGQGKTRQDTVTVAVTVSPVPPEPLQYADVVYWDDTDGVYVILPVADQVVLSGLAGAGIDLADAEASMPAGYDFAGFAPGSPTKFDSLTDDPDPSQTVTVLLTHQTAVGKTETTHRVISYTGAEASADGNPKAVTQELVWSAVVDLVTGVVTYTPAGGGYPAEPTPSRTGYTVDFDSVAALPQAVVVYDSKVPSSAKPVDADPVGVKYSALSKVSVVYVDDDAAEGADKSVTPKTGTRTTLYGAAGSQVGFTLGDAINGVPENYVYRSMVNVGAFAATDQTITVHVGHGSEPAAGVTTHRVISYTGAEESVDGNPKAEDQALAWSAVLDLVTGVVTYTPAATGYPEVVSPSVIGYTADSDTVPVDVPAVVVYDPKDESSAKPADAAVEVEYTELPGVVVIYVDDDADDGADNSVTPKAGTRTALYGPVGTPVGFTEEEAIGGVPDNYVYRFIENVDTFGVVPQATKFRTITPQTIVVHVGHDIADGVAVTKRTIKYTGADKNPDEVVQTLVWKTVVDQLTGKVLSYAPHDPTVAGYARVVSPVVTGYTASPSEVDAVPLSKADPTENPTVTVKYSPVPPQQDPQKAVVVYWDDETGQEVPVSAADQIVLSGPSDTEIKFSQAEAEKGMPAGYVFSEFDGANPTEFDDNLGENQTVTVHLTHGLRDGVVVTTRTITYTGADKNPGEVVQTLVWKTVVDQVTEKVLSYTPYGFGYPQVNSPEVTGYVPSAAEVDQLSLTETTEAPQSTTVEIVYAIPPSLQTVTVVYVDDERDGAPVATKSGQPFVLSGQSGTTVMFDGVAFNQAAAESQLPDGYVYLSFDNQGAVTYDDDSATPQTITVHLGHGQKAGAPITTTFTVSYVDQDGAALSDSSTQKLTWNTVLDAVTDDIIAYQPDGAYQSVTPKDIAGYVTATVSVPAPQAEETAVKPGDKSVAVVYTRHVPDTPVAKNDDYQAEKSGDIRIPVIDFLGNDVDGSGKKLDVNDVTVTLIPGADGAVARCVAGDAGAIGQPVYNQPKGQLEYVMPEGCLQAVMTYEVTVANQTSNQATITVTVAGVANDKKDAIAGQAVEIDVLANDPVKYLDPSDYWLVIPTGGDNDPDDLVYPDCGDLGLKNGKVVYTPDADCSGEVEFTYVVVWTDAANVVHRDAATVVVTVSPASASPSPSPSPSPSESESPSESPSSSESSSSSSPSPSPSKSESPSASPSESESASPSPSPSPSASPSGPGKPVANNDYYRTDGSGRIVIPFLSNDDDGSGRTPDLGDVEIELVRDANGVIAHCVVGQPIEKAVQPVYDPSGGQLEYDVPEGCLQVVMAYDIKVDGQTSDRATITVNVDAAKDDTAETDAGQAVVIDVLGNDPARYLEPGEYSVIVPAKGDNIPGLVYPACGDISFEDGVIVYLPGAGCSGSVQFTYVVEWNDGTMVHRDSATVTVEVSPSAVSPSPSASPSSPETSPSPAPSESPSSPSSASSSPHPNITPNTGGQVPVSLGLAVALLLICGGVLLISQDRLRRSETRPTV
jgi:uncharacterized protein YeaC (DUF1315 family)